MSEDADQRKDNIEEFIYVCPWLKCRNTIRAYTKTGLESLKSAHEFGHRQDRQQYEILNLTYEDRVLMRKAQIDVFTIIEPDKRDHRKRS